MEKLERILHTHRFTTSSIIQILQDIQVEFNYLPKEALEYISLKLKIPLAKIYSIATFYAASVQSVWVQPVMCVERQMF
jgi:NADH-quinone oxidoreductase subunit E